MPNLLKYRGYEEDGVEGYLCLNCKSHIAVRHHALYAPLVFCPFCGIKFEGGWIKDNGILLRKAFWKNADRDFRMLWRIETKDITKWGTDIIGDEWQPSYGIRSDKKELLAEKRKLIKEFTEDKMGFGDSEELHVRFVYYRYYPYRDGNKREEIVGTTKETIVVKQHAKKEMVVSAELTE